MKKLTSMLSIIAVIVCIGAGAFLSISSINAKADNAISEEETEIALKTGKYYKLNGNETEYVEVYSDNTIQMFGFDYISTMKELNGENVFDEFSAEAYAYEVGYGNYLSARHEYIINNKLGFIEFSDDYFNPDNIGSGLGFIYQDENTLIYDESLGYIYIYKE